MRPGVAACCAVLREPYWLRAVWLVVLLSVACVFLGRWQWGRHEGKVAIARADRPATTTRPRSTWRTCCRNRRATLPAGDEWRPVRVGGTYLADAAVLVRNRPHGTAEYGYEVVVPFRVDGGPVLLVDRGWIPNGASGARPTPSRRRPPASVTVVARLRRTEPPDDSRTSAGPGAAHRRPADHRADRERPGRGDPRLRRARDRGPGRRDAPSLSPRPDERPRPPPRLRGPVVARGDRGLRPARRVRAKEAGQRRRRGRPGAWPGPAQRAPGRLAPWQARSGRRGLTDEEWEDLADAAAQAGGGALPS